MDLNLVAAWCGVAVAGLVGVSGVIVGAIGLREARSARADAKEANSLAREANEHAADANQIAREANDISKATAARGDEQHDVAWEWDFDSEHDGFVWIQNIGKNKALQVTIQFMFREVTEANPEPMTVDGRQRVRFEVAGLAEAAAVERKRRMPGARSVGTIGGPLVRLPGIPTPSIPERFRIRVKWRTDLGTPKFYDSDWQTAFLPE